MKTIYILSNESRIVKATRCLDESILWTAQGNYSIEVEFSDYTELSSFINPDNDVYIQNEDGETLATFETELINDEEEHLLNDFTVSHYSNNICVDSVTAFGKDLENLNLTKDLTLEVMSNAWTVAEQITEY